MSENFRSLMVCAGDDLDTMTSFSRAAADCYMIDLENKIPEDRKASARAIAVKGLSLDWGRRIRGVRVNEVPGPHFAADVQDIARARPDFIMLPKVHTRSEVEHVARLLDSIPGAGNIRLWVCVETCAGVQYVDEIASASPRMQVLFFGKGDYATDMGIKKNSIRSSSPLAGHPREVELTYARSRIATSAKAHGLMAIDPGESYTRTDVNATFEAALYAYQFGFDGVIAWIPEQIETIHKAFAPSADDLDWARKVVAAHEAGAREGKASIQLEGVAVTAPLAKSAQALLRRATELAEWDAALLRPRAEARA
ncbi:MAG: CoA ester lyase [Pseudomonadota bacterium]